MTPELTNGPESGSGVEAWRPIPGWDGAFDVSDHGRVRTVSRSVSTGPTQGPKWVESHLLKPNVRDGYERVQLNRDGRVKLRLVHQLVLEAFVCAKPAGLVCRHLDGDPGNNTLGNLRWGTQKENADDRRRHHLQRMAG